MMKLVHLGVACFLCIATGAQADLAITGNDGKQVRAGDGLPMTPTPDSLSVISYSSGAKPVVIGQIEVCGTLQGPPVSVAISPDASFAIAACPQKIGANGRNVPDNKVNVIGLDDPTHPKLLQTVEAGMGATAVSINKMGTMALVTGVGDDTITLFRVEGRRLTRIDQKNLAAKAEPRDVIFAPDGMTAYVLRFGDGKVTKLAVKAGRLSEVKDYNVGKQPDGGALSANGRYLIVNVFGGVPGRSTKGSTAVLDTGTGLVTDAQEVGPQPEHAVFSYGDKYLAIVVGNGSATVRNGRNYDSLFSKLVVFRLSNGKLERISEAQLGHACQGTAWTTDGKRLLVECSVERDIRALDFDGKTLVEKPDLRLNFVSRPGAIASAPMHR